MRPAVMATVLFLSVCPLAHATDRYATPANLNGQLAAAVPGDRVILAAGNYGHLWLSGKDGAPGNLIQIIAQDPANRPVVLNPGLEGWQIHDCTYLLFDGITMQGATEEGFHLQNTGLTHHIIMRNCDVTMPAAGGNTDGWKSDQTYDTLFYNCNANTSGDCGFDHMAAHDVLIMRSHMTNNGNSGVHAKNGSYNIGFYRNVHDNAGERNLQFGGNGLYSQDQVAMGNVLLGSPYGAVYTTVRYCDFAYNTIVNPTSAVIRALNENAAGGVTTAYNSFTNNLIQYTSSTYSYGSNTEPATFTYADNFWSKAPSWPPGCSETGTVVGNPQLNAEYRPGNPAAKDYGAQAPGMEEAFQAWRADHGDAFAWAWSYASNYDPDADAGGPYTIYKHGGQGGSVVLDATGSYAGNNPNADLANYDQNVISAYSWDLSGDNVFGDAAGATPTLTYAAMAGFGRGAVGTYEIELAITADTDYGDMKDWDLASVIVAEAPPGDANFDGTVDGADYTIWADNYSAAAAAPVPAPAVLSLLILAAPALARRRK